MARSPKKTISPAPVAVDHREVAVAVADSDLRVIGLREVAADSDLQAIGLREAVADSDLQAIGLREVVADNDLQAIGLREVAADNDLQAIGLREVAADSDLRVEAMALVTARPRQPQKHIRRSAICNSPAVQSAPLDDFLWTAHVTVRASRRRWRGIRCRRGRSPSSSVFGIQRPIRKSRTGCFITFRHPRKPCHRMSAGLEPPG
jgi:hypothetical protein